MNDQGYQDAGRTEAFNYACSQILPGLLNRAKRIVNKDYAGQCEPEALVRIFLDSVESDLKTIPSSKFKSPEKFQKYLLMRFETNKGLPSPKIGIQSYDPDSIDSFDGQFEDEGIVVLDWYRVPVLIDVDAVEKAAESRPISPFLPL